MQMRRIFLAFKALQELGLRQVSLYGLYQLGLVSGHYRRQFTVYSEQYTVDGKNGALRTDLLVLPKRERGLRG